MVRQLVDEQLIYVVAGQADLFVKECAIKN